MNHFLNFWINSIAKSNGIHHIKKINKVILLLLKHEREITLKVFSHSFQSVAIGREFS
jgi:hypothetical protein